MSAPLNDLLVEAIADKNLRKVLADLSDDLSFSEGERKQIHKAKTEVEEIDGDVKREITRLSELFSDKKISTVSILAAAPKSVIHAIALTVSSNELASSIALLESIGYEPKPRYDPTLWKRYILFFDNHTFMSNDEREIRLQLHWDKPKGLIAKIPRRLRPRVEDLAAVSLPIRISGAYSVVKLIRHLLGSKQTNTPCLGPFLGTPDGLISDLLQFSGLQDGQRIVDIGCGDGRILLSAAASFDCYAVGYETDPTLVAAAQEAISRAPQPGLAERVAVHLMDARDADVSQADVVFIFLPVAALKTLVPALLLKMKPGAVLLAHEQKQIDPTIVAPEGQRALIHRDGVTIVHKWRAHTS